jgi:hypothetical protein
VVVRLLVKVVVWLSVLVLVGEEGFVLMMDETVKIRKKLSLQSSKRIASWGNVK